MIVNRSRSDDYSRGKKQEKKKKMMMKVLCYSKD